MYPKLSLFFSLNRRSRRTAAVAVSEASTLADPALPAGSAMGPANMRRGVAWRGAARHGVAVACRAALRVPRRSRARCTHCTCNTRVDVYVYHVHVYM